MPESSMARSLSMSECAGSTFPVREPFLLALEASHPPPEDPWVGRAVAL